jgi:hypothetical protein
MNRANSIFYIAIIALSMSWCMAESVFKSQEDVPIEVELMYKKGLKYLASTQKSDGSFSGSGGTGAGVVGLCVTAFLAHGEDPNFGPYKDVIKKGIDYIIKKQDQKSGYYGESMYHHGFATLAMAEAYGSLNDKRIGKSLKKAVDLLLASQTKNPMGGWRYAPESINADTTISGACAVGLLAARNSGLAIPQKNIDHFLKFYKDSQASDGGFGYTNAYGSNNIRTAIGVLVYSLARKNNRVLKNAYSALRTQPKTSSSHFYYFGYYNSQALFRMNTKEWKKWNKMQITLLKSRQADDGSWTGQNGSAFSTSTSLLSLALNYRYLPIYER